MPLYIAGRVATVIATGKKSGERDEQQHGAAVAGDAALERGDERAGRCRRVPAATEDLRQLEREQVGT